MVQGVKAFVAKPEDMHLIFGTHVVGEGNIASGKLSSDLRTPTATCNPFPTQVCFFVKRTRRNSSVLIYSILHCY